MDTSLPHYTASHHGSSCFYNPPPLKPQSHTPTLFLILLDKTVCLWRNYVAGKNTAYLGLRVKCPIFLSDFNQIWVFWTDFHISAQ